MFFFFLVGVLPIQATLGQGIKGKVYNESGEPLPFASIYIRNLGVGIPANQNGEYELKLKKGVYDVVVQYLGYATQVQTAVVLEEWVGLDFNLKEQTYALRSKKQIIGLFFRLPFKKQGEIHVIICHSNRIPKFIALGPLSGK